MTPNRTRAQAMLVLACVMYFLFYIDRVNISTAAPLIQSDLGLSNTELGLIFSAFAWPYALFQLVGGWLGDRFGARRTLGASGLVVALATALSGLSSSLAALFAARLVLGFGEGAAFPTATKALAGWVGRDRWAFAQGITHSCARLGNAVTPPLIAALVIWVSWRGSFVILGFGSLIWAIVWVSVFRDRPAAGPAAGVEQGAGQGTGAAATAAEVPWRRLFRTILPVTAVDFCYGWTLWLFLSWIPSFFLRNYHLDLKQSAAFSAGVFFAGVIGDTLGGILSDRLLRRTGRRLESRRRVIILGFAGGLLFLAPVVLVHDLTVAAVCLSLAFFFVELIVAPIWAVPMDLAPDNAATASGMMNLGFGIAGIISPLIFGLLVDLTGSWAPPFLASMGLMAAGIGLCFLIPQPARRPVMAPASPARTVPAARPAGQA